MEKIKTKVEKPQSFYVKDGEKAKKIARLGDFDKPNKRILSQLGWEAVSFNYFIAWNQNKTDGTMMQEAWIKRYISIENNPWPSVNDIANSDCVESWVRLEGRDSIISMTKIMKSINVRLRFLFLFNNIYPENIIDDAFIGFFVEYSVDNNRLIPEFVSLKTLENYILEYTGGPLELGKGFNVTETYLEAYLSKTKTPFPGDCDELVYDENEVKFLIEYKKCTKRDELHVKDQSFKRFVEKKDRIKYTRLNILRKYINRVTNRAIPFVNVIYSVENDDKDIKIELINEELRTDKMRMFKVEENPDENKEKLYRLIDEMTMDI